MLYVTFVNCKIDKIIQIFKRAILKVGKGGMAKRKPYERIIKLMEWAEWYPSERLSRKSVSIWFPIWKF